MSAFHTGFGDRDRAESSRVPWMFAAKVLFALALVLTATFALVRTGALVADPSHLGDPELFLILQ